MFRRTLAAAWTALIGAACASQPSMTAQTTSSSAEKATFTSAVDVFLSEHFRMRPTTAVGLGLHAYDGKLPDLSLVAIKAEIERLQRAEGQFAAFSDLTDAQEFDRQVILAEIRSRLFDWVDTESLQRNPMAYVEQINLVPYVSRPYAPAPVRAQAVVEVCQGLPQLVQQAKENLRPSLPKPYIEIAQLITSGLKDFAQNDVPQAFSDLAEPEKKKLQEGLQSCVNALASYEDFLKERTASADLNFALGSEKFLKRLKTKEGLDIDLNRLSQVGQRDLARNLSALEKAKQAYREKHGDSPADPIDIVAADKPRPQEVLATATRQAQDMRQFLEEKGLMSLPSQDTALLKESPPFMRWNVAFLDTPGLFEKEKLDSFYYISPPDPSWDKKTQQDYIPSHADLLFITVHEVWPGHFLHYLHARQSPSKVAKLFCSYSMAEGWAHYTEELMLNQFDAPSPSVTIGQLQNALLRNVRYISAIGLHTQGMSIEASKEMFKTKGLQDEGNAQQQAIRGTFDPGYLNYTLGKLMIQKLREDYRKKLGKAFSLKKFHDTFLRYQCAPIPVIRRFMLGNEDTGTVL